MRLTDEVLVASDDCTRDLIGIAFSIVAAGRFGLLPSSTRKFALSMNISKEFFDVESLNCLALTSGGDIIDVLYDTRYTDSFGTRVPIPEGTEEKDFYLTINIQRNQWKEINEGYEEPSYTFSLVRPNSPIADYALPIAHLVNTELGWHMDDVDFVPPCILISSHQKYEELRNRFVEVLTTLNSKAYSLVNSAGKDVARIFLPIIQQIAITISKEADLMTPMMLLSNVQKCVSAFTCACDLDEYLELADAESFRNYVHTPYDYKNVYQRTREGLELCYSINERIEKLQAKKREPETIAAPTIDESNFVKKCTNSKAKIPINNNAPGASVYYTIDGSEPNSSSKSGVSITLDSGFNNSRKKEPEKIFVVKVKAILNGISSPTNTYNITLQKDIERWTGIEI